jgi:cellulose synthase/poly-beta-1,6-N-acetylglucosamine synthase-like glycosyltransferase
MMAALEVVLWLVALGLVIPAAVLVAETCAALLPGRQESPPLPGARRRCAVLVPAHDEETGIAHTVTALLREVGPGDRVLVVADNCTDRTAAVAAGCGATVVERRDPARRGKGFALDHGVRWLEQDPPEVVVVVDADCAVGPGGVAALVGAAAAHGRPVQAAYVVAPPPAAGPRSKVSAFAFLYKNVVRPLGLRRLGQPCLLTGTGMAFPWPLLRGAALAHGNIVEDMQLGIDLALGGSAPAFCPGAVVTGELPAERRTALTQRTRWEHGHLQTLLSQVPRLLGAAVRQGRPGLLGLALELSVPPLSMLLLSWVAVEAGLIGWWAAGGSAGPARLLGAGMAAALLAILAAWVKFGREGVPFSSLLAVPLYVCWKVPLYLAFLVRPQRDWVRTQRG